MAKTLARRAALVTFAMAALTITASAQRMHVNGLIGEPPDVSNWPHPAAPDANPFDRSTASPIALAYRDNKADLGKTLFWDEQVSMDNSISCGTCHIPAAGGTDNRKGVLVAPGIIGVRGVIPQAIGTSGLPIYGFVNPLSPQIDVSATPIHSPTMIGAYVFDRLFWDRRAGPFFRFEGTLIPIPNFTDWAACEDLAVGPVANKIEMGHEDMLWSQGLIQMKLNEAYPLALVKPTTVPPDIQWLVTSGADYEHLFDKIFFNDPQFGGIQGVTRERFAMAVAHYMRTLIPDQAPIDLGTMTPAMVAGFTLMRNSGCFFCHSASGNPILTTPGGKLLDPFDNPFSDGQFHNIGFGIRKTPTLRNVGLRHRFFSTGFGNAGDNTLTGIIKFYDNQPGILGLNGSGPGGTLTATEFKQVFLFLSDGLTDKRVATETFPFDRPPLNSEANPFEANEFGNGTPGASGLVPEIIANAPPLVHKPGIINNIWFKIGVGNTTANSPAVLMFSNTAGAGPIFWLGGLISNAPMVMTNPMGIATAEQPLPLVAGMLGVSFFTQWQIMEPTFTVAFSDAAKFVPFQF